MRDKDFLQDTLIFTPGMVYSTLLGTPHYRPVDSSISFEETYNALLSKASDFKPSTRQIVAGRIVFKIKNASAISQFQMTYSSPGGLTELYRITSTKPFSYTKIKKHQYQETNAVYGRNVFLLDLPAGDSALFILDVFVFNVTIPNILEFRPVLQYNARQITIIYVFCGATLLLIVYAVLELLWRPLHRRRLKQAELGELEKLIKPLRNNPNNNLT